MPQRKTPVEPRRANRPRTLVHGTVTESHLTSSAVAAERRRVVIVGAPEDVPRALQHPAVARGRFEVLAVLAVDVDADDRSSAVQTLASLLTKHRAETILVAGPVGAGAMRRVADLALLHHCELLAVMPTEILAGHDPVVVWSGDSPLVQLARLPRRQWEVTAKRVIDIAGAMVGLVIFAPLLTLVAFAIRLESKGKPLFLHERVGYRGRRFQCLKLRTMRADAESQLRADSMMYEEYRRNHFKIPDHQDPRVTPLGRLLRRTSLDEVPQLWNVLVGQMSLVGPRPVIEEELALYDGSRALLLSVRPGITGNWAVSGRHNVGYPERCELELRYVREWSLRHDARILLATVGAVRNPGGDE
jgi:lipopolysaccharide/colanic/teichoic acid biosynthesis glycosyltransferase